MLQLLIGVILVIIASATCSMVEAAFFSIPLTKVRQLAESENPNALALLQIRESMNRPIATIVIINNISNIVGSITLGAIAGTVLGSELLGVFSTIFTFFVIIFAEITPKVAGERFSETIALWAARPMVILVRLFTPLVWIVEKITSPLTRGAIQPTTDENEIKLLARIGQQEGIIAPMESEMIEQVFKLDDITAVQVMTPRVSLTYLHGNDQLNQVESKITTSQHSRIIVIDQVIDNIKGVVLKDDLLLALIEGNGEQPVIDFVREVRFVPTTFPANRLLHLFQKRRQHLAVVIDEFGGVAGIVTLEDVVELLTGEIVDETDLEVDLQATARKKAEQIKQLKREKGELLDVSTDDT